MSNKNWIPIAAGATLATAGVVGIALWLGSRPKTDLGIRLTDIESETLAGTLDAPTNTEVVDIEGTFVEFVNEPLGESASWPWFRGPNHDNIVEDGPALADSWPEGGPPADWSMVLGEGHAGAAVHQGRVYVLDYDEEKEGDALRCFSLADGREFWRRWYEAPTKRNHGISRTIPAVTDDYVVSVGPRCFVLCVDTATGDYRWGLDMVRDYGTEVPLWYTGQCPLIDDGVAILAPSGSALMIGVDCATGEVLWETPNPKGWKMSHSSIIPMTLLGKRTYVYCSVGGVAGVSAEPGSQGELLWETTAWSNAVTSPSAVAIADDRIFLTAGYGGGSMMIGLEQKGDAIEVAPIYKLDKKVFGCEQQTPLFWKGHVLGILPKDASALRGQFVCLKPEGEIRWASGKTERYGLGPFLIADEKVLILDDDGTLTMLRASVEGYEKLARAKVLQGHDAWAPMALVDGRLILRDSQTMICLDLRAERD